MPRIRTLKPEHRQHRKVGPLSHVAYRLWVGMILEADDEGRVVSEPTQLRAMIFAYHPRVSALDVARGLTELSGPGLIRRYTVRGVDYAEFPSWRDHQRIDRPTPSILPMYEDSTNDRESSSLKGKERNGKDQEWKGVEDDTPLTAASLAAPSPNGFAIPLQILHALERAPRLGAVAPLRVPAFWQAELRANPGVELDREILKAEAYLVAHPEKHYRKLGNFLHGWFGRADRPPDGTRR